MRGNVDLKYLACNETLVHDLTQFSTRTVIYFYSNTPGNRVLWASTNINVAHFDRVLMIP